MAYSSIAAISRTWAWYPRIRALSWSADSGGVVAGKNREAFVIASAKVNLTRTFSEIFFCKWAAMLDPNYELSRAADVVALTACAVIVLDRFVSLKNAGRTSAEAL